MPTDAAARSSRHPREASRRDALLLSEYRDPFGHLLHTGMAALALFLAPLGIVPAEVGFWMLVAVSALRSWTLLPAWLDVLRWPCTRWLLALIACALVSLAWSSDPTVGIARMKFLRAALWALLLWPVLGDPWARPKLLVGLLAGILALVATQALSIVAPDVLAPMPRDPHGFGGLHGETAKTGMWCAAGLCLVIGCSASWPRRIAPRAGLMALAAVFAAGLCLSGSLRALGATVVAMLAALIIALVRREPQSRRWMLRLLAAIGALAVGTVLLAPSALPRLDAQLRSIGVRSGVPPSPSDRPNDLELRLLWWGAEFDAFRERPVLGSGWGSTPSIVAESPRSERLFERYPALDEHLTRVTRPVHPHSLYLLVLGELGAVGALLLLATIASLIASAIAASRTAPFGMGVLCCVLMWFAAATLDSPANANSMALGTIIATLAMAPAPVERRTREELAAQSGGRHRVAVFVEKFGFAGGSERYSQETVSRMARSGKFEFHVFANRWHCDDPSISFYRVPMVRFPRSLRPWLFTHLAHRMIERGQYDVVHAHYPLPNATIATLHGTPRRFWVQRVQRRPLSGFDRVSDIVDRLMIKEGSRTLFLPVSSLLEGTFRAAWPTLPGRWHVLHPGVDSARFARNDEERLRIRERLGIGTHDLALLFVGMNFEHKGLETAIRAIARAAASPGAPTIRLIVVGRGDAVRYREIASALGLKGRVAFEGLCESRIESYYHAADAFIMLSAYETFCMAALEAMAAGIPVIITDRMGICDLVRDGEHGIVVPSDAGEGTVSAAILRLTDPSLRARMGEQASAVARAHDWGAVTSRLEEEYVRAVQRAIP